MKNPLPQISRAEWQVMKFLWKQQTHCSAQQIIDELAAPNEWTAATVKTLLNRLVQKGALSFKKEGKAYLYSTIVAESSCRAAETESFLERVFDGSLSPLIAHFADAKKLRKQDIKDLEAILRQSKKP